MKSSSKLEINYFRKNNTTFFLIDRIIFFMYIRIKYRPKKGFISNTQVSLK